MFHFTAFIAVVCWYNLRVNPRAETRGVSRSKRTDLITALEPASWAVSITSSEALNGLGTDELEGDSLVLPRHGSEFTYLDLLQFHAPSTKACLGRCLRLR